jgi:tetratricopeptide (TPR) repeat protein
MVVIPSRKGFASQDLVQRAAQEVAVRQFAAAESDLRIALAKNPRSAAAYKLLGVCQISTGHYAKARESFDECVKLNPKDISARLALGKLLLHFHESRPALEQFEAALALDTNVLTRNPGSYNGFNLLGLCRIDQHRYAEAERAFRRCIRINPNNPTGYINLGLTLVAMKEDAVGLKEFQTGLRLKPDDPVALLNVGLIYARQHNFATASLYLGRAHALAPANLRISAALAGAELRCGKVDEAKTLADELADQRDLDPAARESLALQFLSSGYPKTAVTIVKNQPEIAAPVCRLAFQQAKAFYENGQSQKTIQILNAFQIFSPRDPKLCALLGSAYYELGKPQAAAQAFQEAIRLDPQDADYYFKLGMVFLKYHTPNPAVYVFKHAVQSLPQSPELWFGLGMSEFFASRMPQGEKDLREAIKLRPQYAVAYVVLGSLLRQSGRRREAIQAFQKAIKIRPDWFVPYYLYGKAAAELGAPERAQTIAMLHKAIALNPSFARAHYELGSALDQAGQLRQAAAELKKSLHSILNSLPHTTGWGKSVRNSGTGPRPGRSFVSLRPSTSKRRNAILCSG